MEERSSRRLAGEALWVYLRVADDSIIYLRGIGEEGAALPEKNGSWPRLEGWPGGGGNTAAVGGGRGREAGPEALPAAGG